MKYYRLPVVDAWEYHAILRALEDAKQSRMQAAKDQNLPVEDTEERWTYLENTIRLKSKEIDA